MTQLLKRQATHFTLVKEHLYKRASSWPLLKCLDSEEVNYVPREIHEGNCGNNAGGRTLIKKILLEGYL